MRTSNKVCMKAHKKTMLLSWWWVDVITSDHTAEGSLASEACQLNGVLLYTQLHKDLM